MQSRASGQHPPKWAEEYRELEKTKALLSRAFAFQFSPMNTWGTFVSSRGRPTAQGLAAPGREVARPIPGLAWSRAAFPGVLHTTEKVQINARFTDQEQVRSAPLT